MTIIRFGYCKNIKWYAIFGYAIRLYERYISGLDASHAFVEISDGIEVYRIESVFPHGKISKNADFSSKYKTVEEYSFTSNSSMLEIIGWAKANIQGKKYSFSQNIGLAVIGLVMKLFKSSNWDIENREFNGRVELNCTEAQIMVLAKFLNVIPTEGFDNFSVGEARDLIKSVWLLKGAKNVDSLS